MKKLSPGRGDLSAGLDGLTVNSHIHLPPNFSAFDSAEQAVELACDQGLDVLGLSNYYDFSVYERFAERACERGIFPIFGLEIIAMNKELARAGQRLNDPNNPGKMYICGKGITRFWPMSARAEAIMKTIRQNDKGRAEQMIEKLNAVFAGCGLEANLTYDSIADEIVRRLGCQRQAVVLQERHLSWAYQRLIFDSAQADQRRLILERICRKPPTGRSAVDAQNMIRSELLKAGKPCFAAESFISVPQALELIEELGGIACYPVLADGAADVCEFETPLERLIESLKKNRIPMAEFVPGRNSTAVLREYVGVLVRAGFAVTSGTEHNGSELIALKPGCSDGPVPADIERMFTDGAAVASAVQYLRANGRDVEVNSRTIEALAKLGRAVIDEFITVNRDSRC